MKHLLLLCIMAAVIFSCNHETVNGNENVISELRNTGSFRGIKLLGGMNIDVKSGEKQSVEIKGEENILPYVETYIDDGNLVVKYKNNVNINTHEDLNVYITTASLKDVEILGSGDITGDGRFVNNDDMEIGVMGSGNIKLEVDAPKVKAKTTGSGSIYLSGNTKNISCNTMGSGNIDALELKAENAKATTMGSGDIKVFASIKIDANINGSGNIRYSGGGSVSSVTHGSGSISAAD